MRTSPRRGNDMSIEQEIEGLEIDFDGFDGKRKTEALPAAELLNLKDVAIPLPEDRDLVRRLMDHVLEQSLSNRVYSDSGSPPSLSEIKRIMGHCFRLGRRYEQLRGAHNYYLSPP